MINTLSSVKFKALYCNVYVENLLIAYAHNQEYSISKIILKSNIQHCNINQVRSCYLCIHCDSADSKMLDLSDATTLQYKILKTIVNFFCESISMLQEISFEIINCNSINFKVMLTAIDKLFQDSKLKNIQVRVIIPFEYYKLYCNENDNKSSVSSFQKSLFSQSLFQKNSTIIFNISVHLELSEKSIITVLDEFLKIYTSKPDIQRLQLATHVSLDWNITDRNRDKYWHYVCNKLAHIGIKPYQYWHFSAANKQSMYLRSVYALENYLGMNISQSNKTASTSHAISWFYDPHTACSYMASMSNNKYDLHSDLVYQQFNLDDDFELRLLQARHTEVMVIPKYLHSYLIQTKANYTQKLLHAGFSKCVLKNQAPAPNCLKTETIQYYNQLLLENTEVWFHTSYY